MTYKIYTLDNQFIEETCIWPYKLTGIVKYSNGLTQYFFAGGIPQT